MLTKLEWGLASRQDTCKNSPLPEQDWFNMRGVAGNACFVLLHIMYRYLHFLNIEYQEVVIRPNTKFVNIWLPKVVIVG